MKSKTAVIKKQKKWADKQQLERDDRYSKYANEIGDNLFKDSISREAEFELKKADGSELTDGRYPAKIKALYSSSALACNVFEYWRKREKRILAKALNIKNPINSLRLEKVLNTGISKPNIDVFLVLSDGTSISIESKFCEWMDSKKDKKFKERYFLKGDKKLNRWYDAGLPNCQKIADKIQYGDLNFIRLNAPQLLKHALGIANSLKKDSQLLYLYFVLEDQDSRVGNDHREEIKKFTDLIGNELRFKSMTYQDVFQTFQKNVSLLDEEYVNYLKHRYF